MTVVLALVVGIGLGLFVDRQTYRRIRAERNLARLQRDLATKDREQNNNVRVLDPQGLHVAMRTHPASTKPREGA